MAVSRSRPVALLGMVVIAIAALLTTACNSSSTSSGASSTSSSSAYHLVTPGDLTIGYYPSVGLLDEVNGQVAGALVPIDNFIAKYLKLKPVYVEMSFSAMLPALQSGRIDIIGTSIASTEPRAQVAYAEHPMTFIGPETMIIKPGTTLSTWEEAAAKHYTLASVQGYYQIQAWQSLGINVQIFDSNNACMQDVLSGAAFGCALGPFTLPYLQATDPTNPLAKLIQVDMSGPLVDLDTSTLYVGKDNPALAWAVDQALTQAWRNGTVADGYREAFDGVSGYKVFLAMPTGGSNIYFPGPWEAGTYPTPPSNFASVTTISSGTLTVGLTANSPMLSLTGSTLSGPEAKILDYVAQKMGLSVKGVMVANDASALNSGQVDVVAGELATTPALTDQFWMTDPIAFSPDYMYVPIASDGSYPTYGSWESLTKTGGDIAVVAGSNRIAALQSSGATVLTFPTVAAALGAVADGQAAAFVGTSVDFASTVSATPALQKAQFQFLQNTDTYSQGLAYAWGVKAGDGTLVDDLNQAIALSWINGVTDSAFSSAWPGADVTALEAPGPSLIGGSSYSSSLVYTEVSMWVSGAWLQQPGMK